MGDSGRAQIASDYRYHVTDSSARLYSKRQETSALSAQEPFAPVLLPLPPLNHDSKPGVFLCQPLLRLARLELPAHEHLLRTLDPTVTVSPQPAAAALAPDAPHRGSKKSQPKWRQSRQKLDGNTITTASIGSGSLPMTASDAAKMSAPSGEGLVHPLPTRPGIASHHSSSVPSTPHQHPRDINFRSRSPSPHAGLGSHSPRSVSSEANGILPTLRKPRGGCRFESTTAFGRRRIPYSIGSDMLEKSKEAPKAGLEPHEDAKLSGDMRELYDRLLPSDESMARRSQLVHKLERILHQEWPGNDFNVHVFGSSGNMLCTSDSDVDICIQTPMRKLETMHMLAEALHKHGMKKVVCVSSAKVPIVKIWDPELKLACDMNVNNTLALENTRMIKTYVQIDERVRPLAMIVKYWTKQRILNDAAYGGTLSSYTWICMILNFLQTRDPPILPALHRLPHKTQKANGALSEFADDLDRLHGYGKENAETLGQLLFHFFRQYGHEIDYEASVVSVRHGTLLPREEKKWDLKSLTKEGRDRLCVEEPFNTSRNLGNSADDTAFRGIHLEIRRAFDLLADGGQLDKCCEQYEFPPEEKTINPAFKKPAPAPKPILTHAPPRGGGRNGPSNRGRSNYNQRSGHNFRRASSAASFSNSRLAYTQSPPAGIYGADYFAGSVEQQLYHQYRILEMQQNDLKARLFAQQQAAAQAQARGGSSGGSPPKLSYLNGHPNAQLLDHPPATAPLVPGFLYHYPAYDIPQPMPASVTQEGPKTNPSSPSLSSTTPTLRRSVTRSSVTNGSASGSIRSQSQPARPVPSPLLAQGYPQPPPFDSAAPAAHPLAQQAPEAPAGQPNPDVHLNQVNGTPAPPQPSDGGSPKEYVGYYLGDSPQIRPQCQDYTVAPIPSYQELALRRKKIAPELQQTLLPAALRRVSRSPSPLGGHYRSYSTGLRSAPLPSSSSQREARLGSPKPSEPGGLVIVNGSYNTPSLPPSDPRSTGDLAETAMVDDREPTALMSIPYYPQHDPFTYDPRDEVHQQLFAAELMLRHKAAAELLRSNMANGPGLHGPSAHKSSLSVVSSTHSYPSLADGSFSPASFPNPETHESSPVTVSPTSQASGWRSSAPSNGILPLDTSQSSADPPKEAKSSSVPLLSPVPETRTPSPTANRDGEYARIQQANGVFGTYRTKPGPAANKENVPSPTNAGAGPADKAAAAKKDSVVDKTAQCRANGQAQPNTWQRQMRKSNRKRAKSGSNAKGGLEIRPPGEPLPANEADRKGG